MPKASQLPSVGYLEECFVADFSEGTLTWKERPKNHFLTLRGWINFNSRKPGNVAGNRNKSGYLKLGLDKRSYLLHRLILSMYLGTPLTDDLEVDHINGVRTDNRPENLREVARSQNMKNKKMYSSNNTGTAGVTRKTTKEGHEYFISSWEDKLTGERESVYFSVLKLGEAEALSRAVAHRATKIQHLVALGDDYTQRHGSTT